MALSLDGWLGCMHAGPLEPPTTTRSPRLTPPDGSSTLQRQKEQEEEKKKVSLGDWEMLLECKCPDPSRSDFWDLIIPVPVHSATEYKVHAFVPPPPSKALIFHHFAEG